MAKFEKGHSGNPGGRPKSRELRSLCQTYTADAVRELGRLAAKAKGEMTRVIAIRELLDRSYGRPLQGLEVSIDDTRPDAPEASSSQRQLVPDEVAVELSNLLTTAEKQMGIEPVQNQSNEQRIERLLEQPGAIPPALYAALQQASGTRH